MLLLWSDVAESDASRACKLVQCVCNACAMRAQCMQRACNVPIQCPCKAGAGRAEPERYVELLLSDTSDVVGYHPIDSEPSRTSTGNVIDAPTKATTRLHISPCIEVCFYARRNAYGYVCREEVCTPKPSRLHGAFKRAGM